jgi:hypothetical protein
MLTKVFLCVVFSLVAVVLTWFFSYAEPHVVDAAFVYRGWPLFWFVES